MSPRHPPTCFRPSFGYAHNPLTKYERNAPCFCMSGKKAKKCCLLRIPRIIPQTVADAMADKNIGDQYRILLDFFQEYQHQQNMKEKAAQANEITEAASASEL